MVLGVLVAKNVPYGHSNRFGNPSRKAFFGENFPFFLEVGSYFRKASITPSPRPRAAKLSLATKNELRAKKSDLGW